MRTCYIGLLLLLTVLEQSCSNEEEILQADMETDLRSIKPRTDQNDCKPHSLIRQNLSATLENKNDCYERKEKTIPLKYLVDLEDARSPLRTEIPVQYVIVRASKENCTCENDCEKIIQKLRFKALRKGCDPVDNFYVGGDGFVYEGRGWDKASFWELNGLRSKAITVQFFGGYIQNIPPPQVMEAFRSTLQIGVWLGKVHKNYKIISMRQLFKNYSSLGEKLDRYLMTRERWVNDTFISSLWEYTIPKRLTFVFRSQWNASEPLKELVPMTRPVDHIMISEGGERCLNRSECSSRVRAEQEESRTHYGDLLHNFYIGDEGEVYEGRGWDLAPHWELSGIKNSGLLSVRLIGSFGSELPSQHALNSLKLLIQTGVWLGKISPGYQIFSLRQVYRENDLTGDCLYKHAEGWVPRWIRGDSIDQNELGNSQLSPFVSSSDWSSYFPGWGVQGVSGPVDGKVPIDYVIVYDGDGRCFTRRECTAWMKKEEEKYRGLYGSLLDNFYIGEDGSIYEGRGWKRFSEWSLLFPGISLITVKFMGSFENDVPSWMALTALNTLLKTGIDSRMISPTHRLINLHQTYLVEPFLLNSLGGRLKEMKSWSNTITMDSNGSTPLYRNLIFPRERWTTWPQFDYLELRHPIKYVVVGSVGQRCFTQNSCKNVLKNRYDHNPNNLKSILDNFYIGEDGWAYEGRGWDVASPLNLKGRDHSFLFVMFLGNFRSALPSPIATYGFRHLMKIGVSTGKLAPNYKIFSIRQIFQDTENTTDMLSKDIESWGRWSESIPYSSGEDGSPSGNSIYVSRRNWNAVSWTHNATKLNNRIRRVFVRNVGSRCLTLEECSSVLRAEQNKSRINLDEIITENFYVGEDGHVYEGRGWDVPPPWAWVGYNRDLITVAFLGNFEKELPSPEAVFAFEYLMKLGMSLELIGNSYSLESLKTDCAMGNLLGDALDREIKSWENWRPSSLRVCPSDSLPLPQG